MQMWSMDSDEPVHSLKVDSACCSLVCHPIGKTGDVMGATTPSNESLIAWCD